MRLSVLIAPFLIGIAAPAPGQAPGGQPFRVFFDWSKPELTRDAEAILDEAVAAYQQARPNRIAVAGHSDRSGPAGANLAASRRRAEAVRAYLVGHGVPAAAITVTAYGESRPIVPTEDGVREMQNRRVEISFTGQSTSAASNARSAPIVDKNGTTIGTATMTESPEGISLVVETQGLPAGIHAMHLHAIGRCEPPDFASAGPHWNPTNRQHGFLNPQGPHLGDLPEIVAGSGLARTKVQVAPGSQDADGVALVIHADTDDNRTDPSGKSGARIVCAAFTP